MELRTFITQTLLDIVHAVDDAQQQLCGKLSGIQPTGAELKMKFPGFNIAEHVIRSNVSHDQTLAKAILDHIQGSLPGNIEIRS